MNNPPSPHPWAAKAQVMGIVNVTPDSFSDGGIFLDTQAALSHALRMIAQGADIIDIGGESTRPGAQPVSIDEELARVLPVIEALRRQSAILISVDTSKPEVMREAIASGANFINDIRALQTPGALQVLAQAPADVQLCIMHLQGEPRTMQQAPSYGNIVTEIKTFLTQRKPLDQRLAGGLALAAMALQRGARCIRTHDVAETVDLLRLWQAVEQADD